MIKNGDPFDPEVMRMFRETFTTVQGKKCLQYITRMLGVWEPANNESQSAMSNAGLQILELCGILHEQTADSMIEALLAVPSPTVTRSKEE